MVNLGKVSLHVTLVKLKPRIELIVLLETVLFSI